MLNWADIKGLNGTKDYSIRFNKDINVITGRNGAGKTTVMKLIWYLISGNLECALTEIDFESATICTDNITIEVRNERDQQNTHSTITWYTSEDVSHHKSVENIDLDSPRAGEIFDINVQTSSETEQTVYFPTFRRVEGGYGTFGTKKSRFQRYGTTATSELEDAVKTYSRLLSVGKHKFVTSISTEDVVNLLTSKYADVSEQTNGLQEKLTRFIESAIQDSSLPTAKSDQDRLKNAVDALENIKDMVKQVSNKRTDLLQPFTLLSDLTSVIFHQKGIKVTEKITLGDTKESIASDQLSAGEKQMLSFLCYNSFFNDAIIFIDEPEISLHVDWQRTLVPTLIRQGSSNQFIIATHSPFIYSKYEDKEIMLNDDRGGY